MKSYNAKYLSPPNVGQSKVSLHRADMLGFPGMLGSVDFCKWRWNIAVQNITGSTKVKRRY